MADGSNSWWREYIFKAGDQQVASIHTLVVLDEYHHAAIKCFATRRIIRRDRALRAAEDSADDYVLVQVLNILGVVQFDCATSKLPSPQ